MASGRGRSPLHDLEAFGPDVLHVHNLFPNFGRRWVRSLRVPVVVTVHNFRPLCANGLLFRDGHVCTLCPDGHRWSGLRYACYRGSRLATLPLAWGNRHGPRADPVLGRADRIVMLSELAQEIYERAGVDRARMLVWPNFLSNDLDPGPVAASVRSDYWLYVGRLAPEKGIVRLLERWPAGRRLVVVGDGGPAADEVRRAARGRPVDLVGTMSRPEVVALMRSSIGLVFPSLWFEAFPLVYAEALACGLPVLAWAPNVVAGRVLRDGAGMATDWSEDLDAVLGRATDTFPGLRQGCRTTFEARYSERAYVERATALYRSLTVAPTGS